MATKAVKDEKEQKDHDMHLRRLFEDAQRRFGAEFELRGLKPDEKQLYHVIHMLARDARIGVNVSQPNSCKIEIFLQLALEKFFDPYDPTMNILKLSYFYINCKELAFSYVQEKYTEMCQREVKHLTNSLLLYPETSNANQIQQMFHEMQVFVIVSYSLGSPKNHVLLKRAEQSLRSVLGRSDLQNFVFKKKHHRAEYLQRLSATVCGIMIYNNHGDAGDKENMNDVVRDLQMAKKNTKEALEDTVKHMNSLSSECSKLIEALITINVKERIVDCKWPIEKVRQVNSFMVLFNKFEHLLSNLLEIYAKTEYLISVAEDKMNCIIEKIDNVLKHRTAIDSEVIFPHFAYLSEVWKTLVLYLNHLTEINKIRDEMETYASSDMEAKCHEVMQNIIEKSAKATCFSRPTFNELYERANKFPEVRGNLLLLKRYVNNYCALTMALTNGLLIPARTQKKLCPNLEMHFGFANNEYLKYAELHMEQFLKSLTNVIFKSVDLISLFNLEAEVLRQDKEALERENDKGTRECETQTETDTRIKRSERQHLEGTWNIWDFLRETIRLANLSHRQSHSQQSELTYGLRNAQNQAYNTRRET